jgi:hypothetical protein
VLSSSKVLLSQVNIGLSEQIPILPNTNQFASEGKILEPLGIT